MGGVKKYTKSADKLYRCCGQRGEGAKKWQNYVDVMYGSPLEAFSRNVSEAEAND